MRKNEEGYKRYMIKSYRDGNLLKIFSLIAILICISIIIFKNANIIYNKLGLNNQYINLSTTIYMLKTSYYDTNILFYHNNYGYIASYPTIEDMENSRKNLGQKYEIEEIKLDNFVLKNDTGTEFDGDFLNSNMITYNFLYGVLKENISTTEIIKQKLSNYLTDYEILYNNFFEKIGNASKEIIVCRTYFKNIETILKDVIDYIYLDNSIQCGMIKIIFNYKNMLEEIKLIGK